MKKTEEKKHAKYGASHSHRWLACPASIKLSELAPLPRESKYAKEGTVAHECLQFFLEGLNNGETILSLRKAAYTKNKDWDVEMVDHCFDTAQIIEKMTPKGAERLVETKVSADHFTTEGQFGTVDCAIVEEWDILTVIDFKYGAGIPVDVKDNTQMIYYALGLAKQYDFNFDFVELVIIQPRAEHEDGPKRTYRMTMDELRAWEEVFKAGVELCESEDAETNYGEHCHFCPASSICPEISTNAMEEAKIDFAPEKKEIAIPPAGQITAKELPFLLGAADKLEMWIEAVREHAFHALERGEKVRGFKLVAKRGTRKWIDPEATQKEAERIFGKKVLTTPELLSPAQFEKVVGVKKGSETEAWLDKNVALVSSGITMVPDSDKREAVNQLELDFETPIDEEKKQDEQKKIGKHRSKKSNHAKI